MQKGPKKLQLKPYCSEISSVPNCTVQVFPVHFKSPYITKERHENKHGPSENILPHCNCEACQLPLQALFLNEYSLHKKSNPTGS